MHPILKTRRAEIEEWCEWSGLSTKKVFSSAHSGSKTMVTLHDCTLEEGVVGYIDSVPAPITLIIHIEDGDVRILETEHTRKYLSAEPAAEPAVA